MLPPILISPGAGGDMNGRWCRTRGVGGVFLQWVRGDKESKLRLDAKFRRKYGLSVNLQMGRCLGVCAVRQLKMYRDRENKRRRPPDHGAFVVAGASQPGGS